MPEPATLAQFSLAALVLLVIPGPAVLYIVTRSVDQGRGAGVASVLGVHTGSLVHIAAAALGLSALILSSAVAFTAVKYAGAAYLIYLGMRTLLTREDGVQAVTLRRDPPARIFADGLLVEVLNPKTALFFLAFFPQFIDPSRGAVATQIACLGVVFVVIGLLSDGSYALLAARAGGWLRGNSAVVRARRLVSGGIYLTLGALAALSGGRSSTK